MGVRTGRRLRYSTGIKLGIGSRCNEVAPTGRCAITRTRPFRVRSVPCPPVRPGRSPCARPAGPASVGVGPRSRTRPADWAGRPPERLSAEPIGRRGGHHRLVGAILSPAGEPNSSGWSVRPRGTARPAPVATAGRRGRVGSEDAHPNGSGPVMSAVGRSKGRCISLQMGDAHEVPACPVERAGGDPLTGRAHAAGMGRCRSRIGDPDCTMRSRRPP